MGAAVSFNPSAFAVRYPELQGVGTAQLAAFFSEAGLYHANDGSGPVSDAGQQLILMNMATAHIAALNALDSNGNPVSPLVGRISSASEGSVSVSVQNDYPPGSAQWWQTTKYGSSYWAATVGYRTMQYRVGRQRNFNIGPWR